MRSFLDGLGAELATLASRYPAPGQPAPRPSTVQGPAATRRRTRAPTRLAILATATGAAAAIALAASAPDRLPVFNAPTADASPLAGQPGTPPARRFAWRDGRAFATPDGTGYVVRSSDGQQLCLVLPDAAIAGSFGSSCSELPLVERSGLAGELLTQPTKRQAGRSLVAFVLPVGTARHVRLTGPDGVIPVTVSAGVAAARLRSAATLHFEVRGRSRRHHFEAPFQYVDAAG